MAVTLTVNNIPFDFPEQGDQAPWGESVTGWAQEVTEVIETIKGPYDFIETTITIQNNITNANLSGISFNTGLVRSFEASGTIFRVAGTSPEIVETFILQGLNLGSSWQISQEGIGDSGVLFDIDTFGQLKYTSNNLAGQTSAFVKIRATSVSKT
jgi:hypothetical protein